MTITTTKSIYVAGFRRISSVLYACACYKIQDKRLYRNAAVKVEMIRYNDTTLQSSNKISKKRIILLS